MAEMIAQHAAAAAGPARALARAVPAEADWGPSVLHLTAQLSFAYQLSARARVAALYRDVPRLHGKPLLAALHPLVVEVLGFAARSVSGAFGVPVLELLRFSDPGCHESELRGGCAVMRRLDRIWGGRTVAAIEALRPFRMLWPGPRGGQGIVLRGEVELDHQPVGEFGLLAIPLGFELALGAGAQVLLRLDVVGGLLEAAQAAGLSVAELVAQAGGERQGFATPAGRFELGPSACLVNGRRIRLNKSETEVLHLLAQTPGAVVPRAELAAALRLAGTRNLDRVMVKLRNK
ncbi:MAG: hypothetical protein ACRD1E_02590, partial [Terriglobales bacterium]